MIDYLIGVDGGGSGTRVRLATADGHELAQAGSGPSGLALGIDKAWLAVDQAVSRAFASAAIARPDNRAVAIGLGLAGVHNPRWAADFTAAQPGYGAILVETDAFTTLVGAHQGQPGVVVALGTGSVGIALQADGRLREAGGWGFPAGDEASGAWLGLRAINLAEQVLDGRRPADPLARAVIEACGGGRDGLFAWLAGANQTRYAELAPLVLAHAGDDPAARRLLEEAAREVAILVTALDPAGRLPLAFSGGLGAALLPYLAEDLRARQAPPRGDSASGALRLIEQKLRGRAAPGTHRKNPP